MKGIKTGRGRYMEWNGMECNIWGDKKTIGGFKGG
jgi:hypothetical protein